MDQMQIANFQSFPLLSLKNSTKSDLGFILACEQALGELREKGELARRLVSHYRYNLESIHV